MPHPLVRAAVLVLLLGTVPQGARAADPTVAGHVLTTDGAGVAGARVILDDGASDLREGVSGPGGAFSLTAPASARATLSAAADGFRPARTMLDVGEADLDDVELRLTRLGTERRVSGTVVDADDGAPLAGARVTLEGLGPPATTDAAGAFRFDRVPEGVYDLAASAAGHALLTRPVSVAGGDLTTLVLSLAAEAPTGTVSGRVLAGEDDAPLAGATVILVPDGGVSRTTSTDAAGEYRFEGLGAGRASLSASAPERRPRTVQVETEGDRVVDVRLTSAADPAFVLAGTIRRSDGRAAPGAVIHLDGPTRADATADAEGAYRVDGLPQGRYALDVALPGTWPLGLDLELSADATQDFVLADRPADPGGAPALGCGTGGGAAGALPLLAALALLTWRRSRGSRGS